MSATVSRGEECGSTAPLRWKAMFLKVRHLVFFSFAFGTRRYSQERHAKKKAPRMSWDVATCVSVVSFKAIADSTHSGIAFC